MGNASASEKLTFPGLEIVFIFIFLFILLIIPQKSYARQRGRILRGGLFSGTRSSRKVVYYRARARQQQPSSKQAAVSEQSKPQREPAPSFEFQSKVKPGSPKPDQKAASAHSSNPDVESRETLSMKPPAGRAESRKIQLTEKIQLTPDEIAVRKYKREYYGPIGQVNLNRVAEKAAEEAKNVADWKKDAYIKTRQEDAKLYDSGKMSGVSRMKLLDPSTGVEIEVNLIRKQDGRLAYRVRYERTGEFLHNLKGEGSKKFALPKHGILAKIRLRNNFETPGWYPVSLDSVNKIVGHNNDGQYILASRPAADSPGNWGYAANNPVTYEFEPPYAFSGYAVKKFAKAKGIKDTPLGQRLAGLKPGRLSEKQKLETALDLVRNSNGQVYSYRQQFEDQLGQREAKIFSRFNPQGTLRKDFAFFKAATSKGDVYFGYDVNSEVIKLDKIEAFSSKVLQSKPVENRGFLPPATAVVTPASALLKIIKSAQKVPKPDWVNSPKGYDIWLHDKSWSSFKSENKNYSITIGESYGNEEFAFVEAIFNPVREGIKADRKVLGFYMSIDKLREFINK